MEGTEGALLGMGVVTPVPGTTAGEEPGTDGTVGVVEAGTAGVAIPVVPGRSCWASDRLFAFRSAVVVLSVAALVGA
jgi:hypothetical protein